MGTSIVCTYINNLIVIPHHSKLMIEHWYNSQITCAFLCPAQDASIRQKLRGPGLIQSAAEGCFIVAVDVRGQSRQSLIPCSRRGVRLPREGDSWVGPVMPLGRDIRQCQLSFQLVPCTHLCLKVKQCISAPWYIQTSNLPMASLAPASSKTLTFWLINPRPTKQGALA